MNKSRPIKVGDKIPDFSLKDQNGDIISISNYIGSKKLVIFFYPRDGSLNCTRQACYFRDINDLFEETGAELMGISEQSVESHNHFSQTNRLNYRILSDPGNKVRELFGVPTRVLGLVQGRVTYVVNLNGEVVYSFDSQTKVQRHVDEALRIVMLLKKTDHIEERR